MSSVYSGTLSQHQNLISISYTQCDFVVYSSLAHTVKPGGKA
jgi:hypothetical protein